MKSRDRGYAAYNRARKYQNTDGKFKDYYRTTSSKYQLLHPEVHIKACRKYNDNPENVARRVLLRQSLRLARLGLIPNLKPVCSCGITEGLVLFHIDYDDPTHVEFKCKECFWSATKERNRAKKLLDFKSNP